jgi:hypothetical protein
MYKGVWSWLEFGQGVKICEGNGPSEYRYIQIEKRGHNYMNVSVLKFKNHEKKT